MAAAGAPFCGTSDRAPYIIESENTTPQHICNELPPSTPFPQRGFEKETKDSITSKNNNHVYKSLKESIDKIITREELQKLVDTSEANIVQKSINIDRYKATWGNEHKSASTSKYQISGSDFQALKKDRKERSQVGTYPTIVDDYHTNRYTYYRRALLPKLSYRVFHKIHLKEIMHGESSQQFNKRMAQYNGSELEDYLASKGVLEQMPENESHFGLDADGELLYVYIVDGIPEWQQTQVYLAILELLTKFPNQKPTKKDLRHVGDVDDVSVYHLLDWCPRGHWNEKCVSKQTLANGKVLAVDSIIKLTAAMKNTRIQMSALLEAIDPKQYQENRTAVTDSTTEAYNKLLKACEQDVYLGCVLNTGRCRLHRDWNDRKGMLSAMTPFGFFVGGDMCLPQLGIKFKYAPGNILMCCTQALEHFISHYEGYRIGTVHCSHEMRIQQHLKQGKQPTEVSTFDVEKFCAEFISQYNDEEKPAVLTPRKRVITSIKEDSDEEVEVTRKKRRSNKQSRFDNAEYQPK